MLDETTRQRVMLHQEGAILASVGDRERSVVCEIARCQIDGIANALIRIEGHQKTARFVFLLSDRVTSGIRDVTACLPPFLSQSGESGPEIVMPLDRDSLRAAVKPSPRPTTRVPDFAYGFFWGLIAMAIVTVMAMGKS